MIRRTYAPGPKGKRRNRGLSEYGEELKEKQKLKNWYNLGERQFKGYVKKILSQRKKEENAPSLLIKKLEKRLDNVVFRLGFALSRVQARKLVSHGHFLVNDKANNIPSCQLKKGDRVSLRSASQEKVFFKNIKTLMKKQQIPSWLELNIEKLEGKVIGEPTLEEAAPPVEISSIFEYYSR